MKTILLRYAALCLLLICCFTLPSQAGEEVPPAGLKSEMAGDWEGALQVYRETLKDNPQRVDLWVRMADIQAHLGRPHEAVMSLLAAVEQQPDDAQLYRRLSEAQASNKQPAAALEACREASARAPADQGILRACAQLATWSGDYAQSEAYWNKILAADAENADARLGLARLYSWSGRYGKGLREYRAYLGKKPDDKAVHLEYAQAQTWKGDYQGAQRTLDQYRKRFGTDSAWQAKQARLLALSGRPEAAEKLNAPLLAKAPDDYELRFTRTMILRDHREPRAAKASLADLERLQPNSRDTIDMKRFVLTPQRSYVEGRFSYSEDTDDIRILRGELIGSLQLAPAFSLLAGGDWTNLKAKVGSGLDTADGQSNVDVTDVWLGARWRAHPLLGLDGRVGAGKVEDGRDYWLYRVGLDLDPHDRFSARLQYSRDLYAVSPRSASLGIVASGPAMTFNWRPTLLTTVVGEVRYAELSDDNSRWEGVLAPRYGVLRSSHFNLDLGLLGWWISFDSNFDHGYYDPELYERYAVQGLGYWKISDDDGVSIIVSLGEQRDNLDHKFDFGTDVLVEGVFGLYRDWMFKVGGGYTDRSRESGAYGAGLGYLSVMRRF